MVEAVTTTRPKAKVDGTSYPGPLVLRICGSHREGQIVRLKSAKCTIGSGEHCTLRVRARGVQPLHCVLIRKAARTVVRRWSTDTRLNGASFTDAPLNAGDRLSIGPIEFEVLESGATLNPEPPSDRPGTTQLSDREAKRDSVVERLQAAKDLARKRTGKFLQRLRQANRRIEELTSELHEFGTHGESSVDQVEGEAEIRGDQGELQCERALLEEAQGLLREQQAEMKRSRAELENRTNSIAEQQESLDTERRRWLEEQRQAEETRKRALEEREDAIRSQELELQAARNRWLEEREQFERELEDRKTELERRIVELESARAEFKSDRRQLDQAREDLTARQEEQARVVANEGSNRETSAEAETLRADLERQREEMTRAREELDSLREAIGKEREAVEGDRERCESLAAEATERRVEAERQSGVVAQEAAELRVEREAFAEEQQKWEAAQLDAQKQIEQRAEQLDRQKEALDEQKEALASGQANWEALQAEAESQLAARAEQLDARERELDERTAEYEKIPCYSANLPTRPSSSCELEFLDGVQDTDAKSTSSLDLFRQLEGDSPSRTLPLGDFSELSKIFPDEADEQESSEPEPMITMQEEDGQARPTVSEILLADPVIADSFVRQPSEEPPTASRSAGGLTGEDGEEESIEQYMAGLLARVNRGGDATSAPSPVARRPAVATPSSESQPSVSCDREECLSESSSQHDSPVASQPRPVIGESARFRENGPRARAPERAEDLVSLRELANLSAQSALDTHARSRLMRSVNAKLAVVAVALATAGVLFWRWATNPSSVADYYMGLAVILIAVFWGVQYATLAGYAYLTSGERKTPDDSAAKAKAEAELVSPVQEACDAQELVLADTVDEPSSNGSDEQDATV